MKTFWIILLVAFLLSSIIYGIRSRPFTSDVYRARFFSRMPRKRDAVSNPQDAMFVAPIVFGAATDSARGADSAPDCSPGAGDAGGSCSAGGDGGGASS
jgi:hypothetical protein